MDATDPAITDRLRNWLRAFWPAAVRVDARERWRAAVGALIGILVTGLICHFAGAQSADPWLVAPLGASAVLVFAVPGSPLAQPWAVIGGNTLSALAGTLCVLYVDNIELAAALGVGLAILTMFACRCLHPPGGASALLAVLTHQAGFSYALFPVFVNSLLLVAAGVLYNSLTGRRYPHGQGAATAAAPSRFSNADLDAALVHYNQVLDVSPDDLQALLHHAELSAFQRKLGNLRCADIMSTPPLAVEFGTELQDAWALMREKRIKALPVIDPARRIIGIVTVADFMRQVDMDLREGLGERLRAFVKRTDATHSEKAEVVGQIMTKQVRVASAHRPVLELVPLFSEGGHHHIPIINGERRLVGVITQSDLVRALYRAVELPGEQPVHAVN